MTLAELNTILKATGYPVAYSHFVTDENNPAPNPPFITYLITGSSNMFADDKVYKKITNVQVELYTNYKDLQVEKKLEDVFDQNEIAYESTEIWIDTEKLFQKIYEMGVI